MRASIEDVWSARFRMASAMSACRDVGTWRNVGSSGSTRPGRSRLARQLLRL